MTAGLLSLRVQRRVVAALVLCAAYACTPGRLYAQQNTLRARLMARGLPSGLASAVADAAARARARGLPTEPIVDKALEGWAKRVPAPRIREAVRDLTQRLQTARTTLRGAGLSASGGIVIGAAAEALARGIGRDDVVAIVRAAPADRAAAAGLQVAAALSAQGLDRSSSVRVVVESFRGGRSMAQLLDLPASARALAAQGVSPADVGRELLQGAGGTGQARVQGTVVRPNLVNPGVGNTLPAGGSKRP